MADYTLKNGNKPYQLTQADRAKGNAVNKQRWEQKKLIKAALEGQIAQLFSAEAPPKIKDALENMGLDPHCLSAALLSQLNQAMKGDTKAFNNLLKIGGYMEDTSNKEIKSLQERIKELENTNKQLTATNKQLLEIIKEK